MLGILFYSNKCPYCKDLLSVIQNQDMIDFFDYSCIESMDNDKIIKLGLSTVPTLVLTNESRQQTKILENEDVMKWVKSFILNRRDYFCKMAEQTRKLIQVNNIKNRISDGLDSYKHMESEGISDQYSYYSEKNVENDINIAQPKSFLPIGQEDQYKIIAYQSDVDNVKLNENDMKKKLNAYSSSRKQEEAQLKAHMEKEQIESVINARIGL